MKKITFTLILSLIISISHSQNALEKKIDNDMLQVWLEFKHAVQLSDKTKLKKISADTIWCSICIYNTKEERLKNEELEKNDTNWYQIMYDKWVYIPVDTFYNKDFSLIFTDEIIKRMNDTTKLNIFKEKQIPNDKYYNSLMYRILVTTIDPDDKYDGEQLLLDFKKTKKGYKLVTVITIP